MNYQKYKILKFIYKCPDVGIPSVVIHNVLNIDNIELNKILDSLIDEQLIIILNTKEKNLYSITVNGLKYIKIYRKSCFKDFFDKYLFSIILSIITFILGLMIK